MCKRNLCFFTAFLSLALILTACYPVQTTGLDANTVNTSVAQTVVAMQTQAVVNTLVAELTRVAQATQTPVPATQTLTSLPPTSTNTTTLAPTPLPPTPTATLVPPTATATATGTLVPATRTATLVPCLSAQFVTDVTIPDGTVFDPNTAFTKTWRLKNSGSCSWTTDFDLVFDSGSAMSAPATVAMPTTIKPGHTVDLSVEMVSPSSTGSYTSYWMLRSPNGVLFGLGPQADRPFWVKISVKQQEGSWNKNHPRDFAYNYCEAQWYSSKGSLPCPASEADFVNGSVRRSSTPKLEGGYQDDEMAILVTPSEGSSGYVEGRFPELTVKSGDRFRAVVGCLDKSPKCDVTFQLNYSVSGGSVKNLGNWAEIYDGKWTEINLDLSSLAGKKVQFILKVKNNGSSVDDRAFWLVPMIVRP